MFFLPARLDVEAKLATIVLVPLGRVRRSEVEAVRRALGRTYSLRIVVGPRRPLPPETFYPPRRRYRAEHLIAWLAKGGAGDKVLGVTSADVSTSAHGREDWGIAGLANLGGRSAVVSSFRSKDGIGEVAVHEIGHVLGLPHCSNPGCTMRDADGKLARIGVRFCPSCRQRIGAWLR